MSDFENNIRKSWAENFPSVSPKGCHFHFAKAIWSIVKKMGMKSQYSAANKNPKFGTFIRCVIGLPFVPLERLNEGFQNLERIGSKVKGQKSKDFVKYLLDYIERVWMNGHFEREVWNMYNHRGVTTNNNAESLNSKLGSKNKLKSHPNPYLLVDEFKNQLQISEDKQIVQVTQNRRKRCNTKQ